MNEELTETEIVENYLILLLGVVDRPIPTRVHLQKELFITSKTNPEVGNFVHFKKHYEGPYSIEIGDIIQNPLHYVGAYQQVGKKIHITEKGKEIYKEILKKYSKDNRFKEFLSILKMIREFYDKLTKDELLLLVYLTYPEYKEGSAISEKIFAKKREIAKELLKKGLITEKRFSEILEKND